MNLVPLAIREVVRYRGTCPECKWLSLEHPTQNDVGVEYAIHRAIQCPGNDHYTWSAV